MNPMVPGLKGSKMSSSDAGSKIDFLDSAKEIQKKLNAAHCVEGVVEDNGVLAFAKAVLFPIARIRSENVAAGASAAQLLDPAHGAAAALVPEDAPEGTMFSVSRPEKYGGAMHYASYEQLERDFVEKKIHPADLKKGVADAITTLLAPVRKEFETNEEFRKIEALAYPKEQPAAPKKTVKPSESPRYCSYTHGFCAPFAYAALSLLFTENPRVAHMFTKEQGGTAETEEEAKAAREADEAAKAKAKAEAAAAQTAPKPTEGA